MQRKKCSKQPPKLVVTFPMSAVPLAARVSVSHRFRSGFWVPSTTKVFYVQ